MVPGPGDGRFPYLVRNGDQRECVGAEGMGILMPDIRVTIDSDLHFSLKVMALDKDKTLKELVVAILTRAASQHNVGTKTRKHGEA